MKQIVLVIVVAAALGGATVAAHHSYAAYHTDRIIEVEGTLETFEWINPHSLLYVRAADALYIFEWGAPNMLQRRGVTREMLKTGERIVLTGNPHRQIEQNRIVNLKSVKRVADGWSWPPATR
jgi:hypothetical protein